VCGDDSRIDYSTELSADEVQDLRNYTSTRFGMTIKENYCQSSVSNRDANTQAAFLKLVIVDGRPTRKTVDVWEKLLYGNIMKDSDKTLFVYL
jgi:hypothetical protein